MLSRGVARERRRGGDAPREADRIRRDAPVLLLAQIVWLNDRAAERIAAGRVNEAAARRPQVADAQGDGGEDVQRVAELVERKRLHVEFEVGGLVVGRGFAKYAELRGRHGQWAAAVERIVDPHPGAFAQRLELDVERARAFYPEDRAQLQMILQILADTFERVPDIDADVCENLGTADAGKLEQMRCA